MRAYYEPVLNLSDPEHHNTMGAFLTLNDPVDGEILRCAVEALRSRFPYFYVRAANRGKDEAVVPNDLPMTVRNTWEPISFNTEAANFHLAAWKYEGRRLAFEISHALTDGTGVLPYIESVLYLYLTKATGCSFDPAGFRLPGQPIPGSEIGDPFRDLDVDSAAPLYQKRPIPDFFRLTGGADRDKTVFCLKLQGSEVMRYCRAFDGTPNVIVSVLMTKAARRLDPSSEKAVTAMVCVDHKALLGNHDNYRCFVGAAFLDFPRNRDLNDIQKACTIARGQLMLQAQPENSLWEIQRMKQGLPPPSPDIPQATLCVSYPGGRSFGPLAPWIDEFYIMTSLSKVTDVLCEITCVGHSFFLAFMQPFSSPDYFRCFLEELTSAGIPYELLRREPLRLCDIG